MAETRTEMKTAAAKCKKVSIISFTEGGGKLSRRIMVYLQQKGYLCSGYQKMARAEKPDSDSRDHAAQAEKPDICVRDHDHAREDQIPPALLPVSSSLTEWTGEQFASAEILIFVGAAGIAVRASAPWIRDKFLDPAVLAVDEQGKFVIPLLSGHMGGANAFARMLADALHGIPVITTATDLHGCFAVDVFAREHGLWISDRKLAKEMSAEALRGGSIGIFSDISIKKEEFPGCSFEKAGKINLYLGIWKKEQWKEKIPQENTLQLVPKTLTLGIGCRKNIAPEDLKTQVMKGLEEWGIWPQAVKNVATIALKKEEKAILNLCAEMGWNLRWFSPEELMKAEGNFSYSAFVERTVGVGNVCERAAVLGAGAPLLFRKTAGEGITMAAAQEGNG